MAINREVGYWDVRLRLCVGNSAEIVHQLAISMHVARKRHHVSKLSCYADNINISMNHVHTEYKNLSILNLK